MTRGHWAESFLKKIGAPVTKRNRVAMIVWIASEGGAARWNPLNTTQPMPSHLPPYNSIPVQNYASFEEGMTAAVDTINEHGKGYEKILFRLRRNRHSWWTLRALYASQWGTVKIPFMLLSVNRSYAFYADQPVSSA